VRLISPVFALLCCCAAALHASPVVMTPETVIADPVHNPAWRDLFARLSPRKNRYAHFEERRIFPFRNKPVVLTGELRLAPDRGLSLHYLGDKPHVIVVDRKGVLLRDGHGRERAAPSDGRAAAATSALFSVLSFDLPALAGQFEIHGLREGDGWTLGFSPRDPQLAELTGSVVVHGAGGRVERIEMAKSEQQRIEILLSDVKEDVAFSAEELQRYFR
jgi:outer membrane lipoprotein-sorting protein